MKNNGDSENSYEDQFIYVRGEIDINNPRHIKKLQNLRNLTISRIRQYYTSWWGGFRAAKPKIVPLDSPPAEHRKIVSWVEYLIISGKTENGKIYRYNCGFFSQGALQKVEKLIIHLSSNS